MTFELKGEAQHHGRFVGVTDTYTVTASSYDDAIEEAHYKWTKDGRKFRYREGYEGTEVTNIAWVMVHRVLVLEGVEASINAVESGARPEGVPEGVVIKTPGDELTLTIRTRWVDPEDLNLDDYEEHRLEVPGAMSLDTPILVKNAALEKVTRRLSSA